MSMRAIPGMIEPCAQGVGEIIGHVVLDGASNSAIKIDSYGLVDKSFHDSMIA